MRTIDRYSNMVSVTVFPGKMHNIHGILSSLDGVDGLRRLFFELNYEVSHDKISRRPWKSKIARDALVEDPRIIAVHDDFKIIYSRLDSDFLPPGMERPVVAGLLKENPYALFIFSDKSRRRWHFVNVKYDGDITRRCVFRRISAGPEEKPGHRLRTAAERMEMLDVGKFQTGVSGRGAPAVQARHDEAFDVEKVQKEFFRVFADVYHKVAADLERVPGLAGGAGSHAQFLMDRMLFLYFIQRKGWLDNNFDYLHERFLDCWNSDPEGHNYCSGVLYPLFTALSGKDNVRARVGNVPFLDGGLFEEGGFNLFKDGNAAVRIRNRTFKMMFDELLERFNFTVTEDTPLDAEVAIDPEMLGKIFESLILQLERDPGKDLRKLTGSYYTPRPLVHYMCREALREHLSAELAGKDEKKAVAARENIGALMELPQADHLDDDQDKILKKIFSVPEAKTLRRAVLDCRVCDPAVGSGAFPVMMLHEMAGVVARLDRLLAGPEALRARNYWYNLKREIIESCLYGVDIQGQAVRLCELRLRLSLVVDYQPDPEKPFGKEIRGVPKLPDLTRRLVRGDSLLERPPGPKDRKTTRLAESLRTGDNPAFAWKKDFAEVFDEKGGFDIVIGNPPYIQIKQIPVNDRKLYGDVFESAVGRFNIFYFFIEFTPRILRRNGITVYIVPDRLLLNTQCHKLRDWMLKEQTVVEIVSFHESVFKAVVDSIIVFYLNVKTRYKEIRARDGITLKELRERNAGTIPVKYFFDSPGSQFNLGYKADAAGLVKRMREKAVRLGDIAEIRDGIIQSRITDRLFLNEPEDGDSKRLLFGKDIARYRICFNNKWVNYKPVEMMEIEKSRGTGAPGLRMRKTEIFERNKILTRQTADEIIAAYDRDNYYYSNTLHGTTIIDPEYDPLYVLGVLNSSIATWYYRSTTAERGKVFAQIKIKILKDLPVPRVSRERQRPVIDMVNKIHKITCGGGYTEDGAGREAVKEYERRIDGIVGGLYGLTEVDCKLINS